MRTLLLLIAVTGCSDAPAGPARNNFLGSWSDTTGTIDANCGGQMSQKMLNPGEIKLTITQAAAANEIVIAFADPAGCQLTATVSGATATLGADVVCPINGGTLTIKAGGTFTTSDGVTLSASFSNVTAGSGTSCTQTDVAAFAH